MTAAAVQTNAPTTGGITGKGFQPGQSGNPGGRPKGLEKKTRELVGQDGEKLATFWLKVMNDPKEDVRVRLEASKLLADRAFGRPAQAITGKDGGPLEIAHVDVAGAKNRVLTTVDELAERRAANAA